ncbi:DUF4352 domain-containing protein [Actinosynnema sp. NPDC020468]|uniref:DUF4352 domain-containing protein n=1 Tax=Actinosynnema sp. NPDC020468 TaxID=3154488 RepID=UPI0033C7C782
MRGVVVAVALLCAAGCTGGPTAQPPPSSTTATYPVPAEPVRPDEKPLSVPTTADGDTAFTLLGLTTGMETLIGSHAEWPAKGRFARVRMVVVNNGRSNVLFDARKHVLLDEANAEYQVDTQAMLIKRQPDKLELGAGVRLEYDVYYDLPKDAKPRAIRVFGGPTLTDLQDQSSTEIALGGS